MMTIIGFALAAAIAYWVYGDAKSRGHETGTAIMWSVGTFALMIVFLPLYFIFGRKPKMTRKEDPNIIDIESVPVEETTHCTMCGAKVKRDFKSCPYCSHTLQPKCDQCGREINREWRTCPYCEAPANPK
jgi:RNA polymerase subunit RPABC4/transcription elongation factor Spt4